MYVHLAITMLDRDCTAACRIYAQKGIYDTLVEKLGAAVATLKSGAPDDESTELGPLKLAGASRTRQQGSRRGESDRAHQSDHWR